MAKSTIMMPFFLTMPISRMMPIMRDQTEVEAEQHQRRERADAGRRQRRQDRQRVDVALVEHAEDDVDDDERRGDQQRHRAQRGLEGLRVALERADQRSPACRISRSRLLDRLGRLCRATTPGARLKLMVTAGNWPWWLIDSGLIVARASIWRKSRAAPAAR